MAAQVHYYGVDFFAGDKGLKWLINPQVNVPKYVQPL